MANRFIKPKINWVEFEKRVPLNQKGNFMAFKAKSDSYYRRVLASPAEPPKINWDEYRKIVPIEGLVDKFKTEYEAFEVPYPADTLSSQVDEQWKTLEPQIKKFCEEQQQEIEKARKELNKIKSLPAFDDMTMEMFHQLYPNIAIDPINRPTYWPHDAEEQPGYVRPESKVEKGGKKANK